MSTSCPRVAFLLLYFVQLIFSFLDKLACTFCPLLGLVNSLLKQLCPCDFNVLVESYVYILGLLPLIVWFFLLRFCLFLCLYLFLVIHGYGLDYLQLGYHRCRHGSSVQIVTYALQGVKVFFGQEALHFMLFQWNLI